ncbi:MAG: hypothetical protein JW862_02765 [Anaerolineales bacterium]|nr:hypothetical protein [Anaerolineales bacterium]
MALRLLRPISILILLSLILLPMQDQAQSGTPSSAAFGYGLRLELQDPATPQIIRLARDYRLEWVALDFSWQTYQPDPDQEPDWTQLDIVMQLAKKNQLAVMIGIVLPPAWAMLPAGPDPSAVQELCAQILQRYPGIVRALELFPGANTHTGWGTDANPAAYSRLVCEINQGLAGLDADVLLIGPGLSPATSSDFDPLEFLQASYQAGVRACLPVISIRLPTLESAPRSVPAVPTMQSLRFYETVRQVMLEQEHTQGVLWISALDWQDRPDLPDSQRLEWVHQAYLLMRAQLYMGAAFYQPHFTAHTEQVRLEIIQTIGQIIALENGQVTTYFEIPKE